MLNGDDFRSTFLFLIAMHYLLLARCQRLSACL